jgi:F-type H+-transporting ATPase subunit epsilon
MAKTFHLTVARVGENIFDGEALSVLLPGTDGSFTVLAGHEPFVSELKEGDIHIEAADGTKHHVPIAHRGVAEVSGNQATVLL